MNKFEQVNSLDDQMSLAGRRPGLESLYSEVPCPGGQGGRGLERVPIQRGATSSGQGKCVPVQ